VNKKGFTLIEILAVIGLISILMMFVTPSLAHIFSGSLDEIMKTQEKELEIVGKIFLDDFCKNPLPNKTCPSTINKNINKEYNGFISLETLINEEYMNEVTNNDKPCTGCVIYDGKLTEAYLVCEGYETKSEKDYKSICNIK